MEMTPPRSKPCCRSQGGCGSNSSFVTASGSAQEPRNGKPPHEQTPLVGKDPRDVADCALHKASAWQFWRTTSPSHRFFLLFLMSCIPFGGHFVKNGMSSLEQLMLDDPDFPISNTMYGALVSAVSVPNMFIPLFGGRLMDKNGHRSIRFFLVWICLGQAIFAIGMQLKLFWLALFGRVFFGVGEGSVVVGARVFIAYWFRDRELTFAMGVGVAVTNVSKMLAKATVAPVALYFGGYVQALWYGVAICLASVGVGSLVCMYTARLKSMVKRCVRADMPLTPELHWMQDYAEKKRHEHRRRGVLTRHAKKEVTCESVKEFSRIFWVVAILHVVFINVFHLFQNVSSSYLYQRYGYSLVKSGIISSLSHSCVVFAPITGLLIDQFGGRMFLILGSSLLSILAYALMIFTEVSPHVSMIIISICLSFTPTILIAAIPATVHRRSFGAAFGIVEIFDAIGATFGNLVIGYIRDATGSYTADMYLLLGLAISACVLSIVVIAEDRQSGWVLSAPTRRSRAISMDDEDPVDNPVAIKAQLDDDSSGDDTTTRTSYQHKQPPKHTASEMVV
ncbi:TPA: hypothetical protein N0F65_010367 [Lagenidium giganteum]|uniref:Lysosomal dipeptide transporter MFSD1 n=1 Tax=Lagenidium giganteum TaxID=4803 RepID=A0AAV2YLF9_9STRA|nr:TPA: hypothetical protein N0F65_010367 [Lagenidium giganteum]